MAPRYLLACAVLLLCARPSTGQNAADRVFPPGGQRGTTVTLTFPAMDKVDSASLVVDGEGVRALGSFVKGVGKVEIAPDAEPGVRQVRLIGPKTATAPRPFAVGVLPEVLEQEPNDGFDKAQRLEKLPVTLNGAIPKPGDTDNYRLALKKGDCLVVASESRRLAGPVYLAVTLRDAQARAVPVDLDTRRRDPVFTASVPADGEYLLQVADVTSNMGNIDEGCQYRLHVTTGPWLDFALPPSVNRGASNRLTVHGWNLGGKPGPGTARVETPVPAEVGPTFRVTAEGAPHGLELPVIEAETAEAEPNAPDRPQEITLPAALHGTFEKRGDTDAFRFTAAKGDTLRIDVDARDSDSLADPRFVLQDSVGKTLLTVDDAEGSRDPREVWTAPADGSYTLLLRDLAGGSRGGPGAYYRLSIAPVKPDLRLVAKEPTTLVKPGAAADLQLTLYQSWQPEEITLHVDGLPAGVTAEPVKVPAAPKRRNTNQVKLVIKAAADAKPGSGVVRVTATTPGGFTAEAVWMLTGDGGVSLGTGSSSKLVVLVPAP